MYCQLLQQFPLTKNKKRNIEDIPKESLTNMFNFFYEVYYHVPSDIYAKNRYAKAYMCLLWMWFEIWATRSEC